MRRNITFPKNEIENSYRRIGKRSIIAQFIYIMIQIQ